VRESTDTNVGKKNIEAMIIFGETFLIENLSCTFLFTSHCLLNVFFFLKYYTLNYEIFK